MTKTRISTAEAIMLVLSVVVTHTIMSLPRDLLVLTQSATIINLIYISIIAILIAYLIYRLLRNFPRFRYY